MSLETIELLSESQRQAYADRLAAELLPCPQRPSTYRGGKFDCTPSTDEEVSARVARFYHLAPVRSINDRARARAAEAI